MSIQSEINRISQNVADSLTAVAAKGVIVPSGSTSDDLPDLIAQISSGGGGGMTVIETQDSHGGTIVEITGEVVTLQTKTNITPTESSQTIQADEGYTGLSSVQINPISSTYIGSGITSRSSSDLSASGATVTVPSGYYASQATKSVANGTIGTPTATKGAVSNHSISVTPSVNVTTEGYVTSGARTGTAVTVSASELVSGSETKTANGTYDVTNLASLVVNVASTSKNVQTEQSTTRRNNTALGSIISLTCSTSGTYDVYWTCARTNTSQTWGSQLYIGGVAYGTENTTWSNNVQNNYLTGVSIVANQTVAVYGRSRSGYYIHAPQLTIVQTS